MDNKDLVELINSLTSEECKRILNELESYESEREEDIKHHYCKKDGNCIWNDNRDGHVGKGYCMRWDHCPERDKPPDKERGENA